MAKYGAKASEKVEKAMHERKRGALKSGSGKKVTSKKQAIAIGLSRGAQSRRQSAEEKISEQEVIRQEVFFEEKILSKADRQSLRHVVASAAPCNSCASLRLAARRRLRAGRGI